MEIRQDIQFLRGLAVLVVVLFHLQIPFFEDGFLGVDVFFVISGFLMAKIYSKGDFLNFYKRRLDRLYPAYIFTIFFTLIVGVFITIPVDFNQLFDQAMAGLFFFSNIFYWNQNSYFDKAAFNPIINLWSLSIEAQFYLIVPLLYPFLRGSRWLFVVFFVGSLVACLVIQTVSPKTSFFLMPLRIWEFLIGAWVAWWGMSKSQNLVNTSHVASIICVFALIVSLFAFTIKPDATGTFIYGHPALPALVITLLTGLVINYGIHFRLLGSVIGRLVAIIGDYSYSIYLVHFPIIVLLNYVPFGGTQLVFDDKASMAVAVAAIFLVSFISYIFIEKRFAKKLNLNKFSLSVFVLISAFALTAFNLDQYSASQKNIFSAWNDRDAYRCGKIFRILHPTDIVCAIGEGAGNRNVLLIGNSHADSIKKVFASKASEHGISTYFAVSNDPLIGSGPIAELFIAESLKRNIDVIVLHYSNIYENRKSTDEVARLIELARDCGIKVVFIGPVPTYVVHIPKAMFEGAGVTNSFQTTRTQHLEETKQFRDFVFGFKGVGVEIYDPSELLCGSDDVCLFSGNDYKPYYFDSNHLTLSGAYLLNPLFDRLLKDL